MLCSWVLDFPPESGLFPQLKPVCVDSVGVMDGTVCPKTISKAFIPLQIVLNSTISSWKEMVGYCSAQIQVQSKGYAVRMAGICSWTGTAKVWARFDCLILPLIVTCI